MSSLDVLLQQNLNTHSVAVLAFAFLGGLVSSFLPCMITMLPILVGYMGAFAEDSRWAVFRQVGLFIVGLSLVMTVLGVVASLLGLTFGSFIGSGFYYAIGAFAIVMALHLLNVFHIPIPATLSRLPETPSGKILAPITLGIAFGVTSSPCGTPFLAAILSFISREHNILLGASALFSYALGQGAVLLAVGLFTGLLRHMAMLRRIGATLTHLSAGVFLVVGALLIAQGAGVLPQIFTFLHLNERLF